MSVVTEVLIELKLRVDTPKEVLAVFDYYINNKEAVILPNHPFFKTERCRVLLSFRGWTSEESPSFFKIVPVGPVTAQPQLRLHANINYEDGEVDTFLDWISPYVGGHKKKKYAGWRHSEYDTEPINLYIIK